MKQVGVICLGGPYDGRRIMIDDVQRLLAVTTYPEMAEREHRPGRVTSVPIERVVYYRVPFNGVEFMVLHDVWRREMYRLGEWIIRKLADGYTGSLFRE